MVKLIKYEFTCPFCGKDKFTFVTQKVLDERPYKKIQESLPPAIFDKDYKELLVANICSACQLDMWPDTKPYDADKSMSAGQINILENKIREMYENAERK